MRDSYYCPYCNHRSTRRWNLDVHIKRRHGWGRSSDRFSYNNSVQIRHARVADSVADTFQPRYTPQQTPLATSQYYASPIYPPLDVPQTFANPMYRPMQIRNDERSGTSLSPGAIEKIQELKALMNKYPRYHTNPDGIIRLAVYNSINGDDTLLDDKLEQLRTIDSLAKY